VGELRIPIIGWSLGVLQRSRFTLLPNGKEELYMVARWRKQSDTPLISLTNLVVEDEQQARQIVACYKKRWSCEETVPFLKSRIGIERFRISRYDAIKRLMILAMLAMGFLTWVLLKSRQLTKYFSA